jgi:putative ABC transport system permease protein
MNFSEIISTGINGLRTHMLRTFLTMLGIIFGVGAVIAMLSIGEGAKREALEIINLMGAKNIIIQNLEYEEEKLESIREKSPGLSLKDFLSLKEGVPYIEHLSPQRLIKANFIRSLDADSEDARVVGTDARYPLTLNLLVDRGRFFDEHDNTSHANICVIGHQVRRDLFAFKNPLGQRIKINQEWFEVVGTILKKGKARGEIEGIEIESIANDIYIPINTAMKKFELQEYEPQLSEIAVTMEDPGFIRDAAVYIDKLLFRLHRETRDYKIVVPEELLRQTQETQRIFNIAMGFIAGISLLVGGIGIMNIMLASILERTREIGIRRAIGAKQIDIMSQFIAEAVFISLVGGLIGIAAGAGISKVVGLYTHWRTLISAFSIIISFGISVSVGLIFGIYPAYTASHLNPIEALRYE